VKGYHAEEREEKNICRWRATIARECLEDTHGNIADELIRRPAVGHRQRSNDGIRRTQDAFRSMTPGQWFAYNAFLAFLIAPVFQIVAIGTQITEAITGLEPHAKF